jgi:hemoglobin-like flavoprotein
MIEFALYFRLLHLKEQDRMITAAQTMLVQESFGRVQPVTEAVATEFYRRLFDIDPSLRSMFRGSIEEQGRKLMQVLTFAVQGLERLDQLVPAVEALGRRHAGYGVRGEHYVTVGTALLDTLNRFLGEDFTPELRAAWETVYQVLATTMMNATPAAAEVA